VSLTFMVAAFLKGKLSLDFTVCIAVAVFALVFFVLRKSMGMDRAPDERFVKLESRALIFSSLVARIVLNRRADIE
jgi:predicted Co/Zn/Cd cation transporter (cation efflux family)